MEDIKLKPKYRVDDIVFFLGDHGRLLKGKISIVEVTIKTSEKGEEIIKRYLIKNRYTWYLEEVILGKDRKAVIPNLNKIKEEEVKEILNNLDKLDELNLDDEEEEPEPENEGNTRIRRVVSISNE